MTLSLSFLDGVRLADSIVAAACCLSIIPSAPMLAEPVCGRRNEEGIVSASFCFLLIVNEVESSAS